MDNKQGTIIGVGCLSLCSLYYFYRQFSQDNKAFKRKLKEMRDIIQEIKKSNNKINYESIQQGKKQVVLYPKIRTYQLNSSTYSRFSREISKENIHLPQSDHFQENQTGGNFKIFDDKVAITVDIKDCNIHTQIIEQTNTQNIIFPQNKKKTALFYSSSAVLKSMQNIALYGVLSYSLQDKKFILEPWFLMKALKSDDDTFEQLVSFWEEKIYKITFKKMAIGASMATLAYLLIYRPIKNIWLRYKAKKEGVSQGQLDYFKQRVSFYAKNQSSLNCEFCRKNTISYAYQCGHLVACDQCYSDQKNHKCQLCGRKSRKFMKIFI